MSRKERFEKIFDWFSRHNSAPATELKYTDPYQLLVAVMLSAQCTDKRVNMTTPAFFKKFPTLQSLANTSVPEVFPLIKSISYPNNKAKHLVSAAKMLVEKYNGIIPSEPEELQKIPGVGRKTANVLASALYRKPVLAVDTHVFRVSARLGLTRHAKNPLQAEKQLVKYIPEEKIPLAHHWLILHGRYVCTARKPRCTECGLKVCCRHYRKFFNKVMHC